jgi:hypothetical protein
MAKKFEIVGQSLVITDESIPKVLFDFPKGEVYYDSALLINEGIIKINNIDALDNAIVSASRVLLTDAVDGTGTPFTESTFISFARTNLGFKTASGGSGAGDQVASSGTGTVISLTNPLGYYGDMTTANTATTYTTTGTTLGAFAVIRINAATQPTVDGSSTPLPGATFAVSTDMHMVIQYFGVTVQFYFIAL